MLGVQPNVLLSPTSKSIRNTMPLEQIQSVSGVDEKTLKDIFEILSKQIDRTKHLTEFSKILHIENINTPTLSGHTDFFYPNLSYFTSHYQQELPEISRIKHVPIPAELVEQFSQVQFTCFMGLFTVISRAWLTIDNLIFFWNYEDGSDICFYDNLTETILAVDLVVPKPGTFEEGVEYALCLATNSQVILLSIDFLRYTKGNGAIVNEMRFSQQPIYSIQTDNSIINVIRSSKSTGRIFMGAKDGCLYEFFYQNQAGWFSSQTKRINLSQSKFHYLVPSIFNFSEADSIIQIELDETRNVLYTRSENSAIQVFYLGAKGVETSKIALLNSDSIASKAASLINSNDKSLFMPIIHISTINYNDSRNVSLVAFTQYGLRLFFSINQFEQFETLSDEKTQTPSPSLLQLVHLRMPYNIELFAQNRNGPVTNAYSNSGISLMISRRNEQNDSVILFNRDLFLLHSNFKESRTMFDIDGRIWSVEEILPSIKNIRSLAHENEALQTATYASGQEHVPKLTAEYFDLPRRFAMITPQGCFIWNKLRPIDQLTAALREGNGPNSEGVRLFFHKIYERSEASALCLATALQHVNDARILEWATQAYFLYSGEPEIRKQNRLGSDALSIQPNHFPSTHHQPYGLPQASLMADSGVEHNENTIYGDMSYLHSNRYFPHQQMGHHQQQQQQQQHPQQQTFQTAANKPFTSVSYLNSPQQMSTPITMRTKEQISSSTYQQPFGSMKSGVNPYTSYKPVIASPYEPNSMLAQQKPKMTQNECEIHFSGKHDALYIYLSRLLAPIWNERLLVELMPNKFYMNNEEAVSFASFAEISVQWYLNKLNDLRQFIDVNFPHIKTLQYSNINASLFGYNLIDNTTASQTASANTNPQIKLAPNQPSKFVTQFACLPLNMTALANLTANAQSIGAMQLTEEKLAIEIENGSIYLIRNFLNRIIEVFGLWKILDDHKFHFISAKLDKQTQMLLLSMEIKNFILADDNLLKELITALIYRYLDDNVSTDMLNQSLKQMCSSLYTNESAIFSKACEKLKQALLIENDTYERDRLLKEAVELMKQIGYVTNLTQVCDMLYSAGCFESIFELCLTAAEKRDPQNIALHFYRKCEPPEDAQGQNYFSLRSECYKCMLDCLNSLIKTPVIAFNQTQPNRARAINTKEKLEETMNSLIRYVVNTRDELAHVTLFNWMINSGLEKKLVTLDSPFLENFLIKEVKEQSKNRIYLDLLWRHYDYKKDYQNAAKVLTALAEKYCESQINLKERVEYLTQAIVALNSSSKTTIKDEIAELSDKKDVALLQEKIYEELYRIEPRTEAIQDALVQLDSKLFDITKLYYDFAEKFDLYQCQLAIFKMAGHEDPKTIEVLWKQIIANELDKVSSTDVKPSDMKNQLVENLVNIGKEYAEDDEKYFPLITLIDSLEYVSLSRGFQPEWASYLLRRLNVPFSLLLQGYKDVYQRKDVKWSENLCRFIESIHSLFELFIKAPNATNENDRKTFIRAARDTIPYFVNELKQINDESARDLISKFSTLNYMLVDN